MSFDNNYDDYDSLYMNAGKSGKSQKSGKSCKSKSLTKNQTRLSEQMSREYFGNFRDNWFTPNERRFTISFRKMMQALPNKTITRLDESKRMFCKTGERNFRMRVQDVTFNS